MTEQAKDFDLIAYVEQARSDAGDAFNTLRSNGTLSASLTFHITHKIPGQDKLLHIRSPGGLARDQSPTVSLTRFSDHPAHIRNEDRLGADPATHVHTVWLSAWSLAHKTFPL